MDLWHAYLDESKKEEFGKGKFTLRLGKRWHTSLSMVMDSSLGLELNKAFSHVYSEEKRYITAKDITFDIFASVYDVDTGRAFVMRPSAYLTDDTCKRISSIIRKAAFRNAEMRVIGLQSGDQPMRGQVSKIRTAIPGVRLVEVDLFGNETRHITLDMKTGSTYDLLLNNKIYTPAELINNLAPNDFAQKKSELAFV